MKQPAEKMYGLAIELIEGGGLRLTQQDGINDPDTIDLHPVQIRLIAERAGLLRHEPDAARVPDLERRIAVLADRLQDFVCSRQIRTSILECGDGFELIAKLDGILDLALEFDGGRLKPEEAPEQGQQDDALQEKAVHPAVPSTPSPPNATQKPQNDALTLF